MPVSVKEYINSMKSISSSESTRTSTSSKNLQYDVLLADLIEAIAYSKSIDFKKDTLKNSSPTSNMTGKQIIDTINNQKKLISQLAEGQKLSSQQNKELKDAINNFYEIAKSSHVNYKKYADQLERFSQNSKYKLPENVKNRLANDSRDAHIIGTQQGDKYVTIESSLKRIKYLLEDSWNSSKQFRKKLFVTLSDMKEGLLEGFNNFKENLDKGGNVIKDIIDGIKTAGMAWMFLQGQFKEGKFGAGIILKQFMSISKIFSVAKKLGSVKNLKQLSAIPELIKGFKTLANIPKLVGRLGKFKGLAGGIFKASKLGLSGLKKVPVVGLIISLAMAWHRWNRKDYAGALIELGSGVASLFPGIGTAISIALDLLNYSKDMTFDKMKEGKIPEAPSSKKWYNPFTWFNKSNEPNALKIGDGGGDGETILKDTGYKQEDVNALIQKRDNSKKFGSSLAASARSLWGNIHKSGHYCARGVRQSLANVIGNKEANKFRGNAWTWINSLKSKGQKYFDYKGQTNSRKSLVDLPPGSIVVWNKNNRHKYGHVEIADGRGNLISDFTRPAGTPFWFSEMNPHIFTPKNSGIIPTINSTDSNAPVETSSAADGTSTLSTEDYSEAAAEQPKSFSDIMKAFEDFNSSVVGGVSGTATPIASTQIPSASDISAGTPTSSMSKSIETLGVVSKAPKATPAPQATTVQTISSEPSKMVTDINDTDLALLNSILLS